MDNQTETHMRVLAVFTLPMPPSVNTLYKNVARNGRTKTQRYIDWIAEAGITLAQQHPKPMQPPYQVDYAIGRPNKRKRDVANLEKALSDLLVKYHVLTDDSEIDDNRQRWALDVEPGFVRCTITSLNKGEGNER